MRPRRHAQHRLRTRIGHTAAVHLLCKTPWSFARLVGMRELTPVRVVGISSHAAEVPRTATRMTPSEPGGYAFAVRLSVGHPGPSERHFLVQSGVRGLGLASIIPASARDVLCP